MKILGRIVIILIAALAVAGAATALAGNSSARLPEAETEPHPFGQDQPGGLSTGSPDRFHEGERDAPSLFGIVGVVQNLVIVSFIIGLVTLGPHLKSVLARLAGSFHNI